MLYLAVSWSLAWWAWLLILLGVLLVGGIAGFLISRKLFTDYLEMIRVMMQQMGRTPSEKQVRQVMASMNQAKNSK